MPTQTTRNLYRGINPHLQSHLQAHGRWPQFHTAHITYMLNEILVQVLPKGYTAEMEESMQIRRDDDDGTIKRPKSDIEILDRDLVRAGSPAQAVQASGGPQVMALPDVLEIPAEPRPYRAVAIYQDQQLVAWIELLSPSNKPGGRDAGAYADKRYDLIRNGLVFVEIDYLHETAPSFNQIPAYRRGLNGLDNPHATAYRLMVIDPRPGDGQVMLYGFGVDEPLPTVTIPLSGDDSFDCDFDAVYQKTFRESLYGLRVVDYDNLPENFDRYSLADQRRILNRLNAIRAAQQQELDLETVFIESEDLVLEDAQRRYQELRFSD